MDEEKLKEEEYEVYFTTPSGKFVDFIKKDKWTKCLGETDTEPTSLFTIKITRSRECVLQILKGDVVIKDYEFDLSTKVQITNGESLIVETIVNTKFEFCFSEYIGICFASSVKNFLDHGYSILTIHFANQPRHVIK